MEDRPVRRALISVSNKTGIVEFARRIAQSGVAIISTGGTARLLEQEQTPVQSIDSYTGFPEIMDGRVKTLHPRVHGGILAVRDNEKHKAHMQQNGIEPLDLVVVNLYPFRQTIAKEGVTIEEAVENIDIGGPTMVRSAAKNHAYVTVVVDPSDYDEVAGAIESGGSAPRALRKRLAFKAFQHTAEYDAAIAAYLADVFKQ